MTRDEFYENVDDCWDELIAFANTYCPAVIDDMELYSEAERDDCINENLESMARRYDWEDLRDKLYNIPVGYDYYQRDNYDESWYIASVEDLRTSIVEYMDNKDLWDVKEDEEEPDVEDISIYDLLGVTV